MRLGKFHNRISLFEKCGFSVYPLDIESLGSGVRTLFARVLREDPSEYESMMRWYRNHEAGLDEDPEYELPVDATRAHRPRKDFDAV